MASDLMSIARSGASAARIALDVTAQNIANASSEGYIRRSARLEEVSASGGLGRIGDLSLSGVRLGAVVRNADLFRQSEVRRTGADAARAQTEVTGLENIEAAVEAANVHPAAVRFEASLQQLMADPVSPSLRAAVIEDARTMVRAFNIAADGLATAGEGLRFQAADGVTRINRLAGELGRVNVRLARAADASSDQTALLDQRDNLLKQLSEHADVSATIATDHTARVSVGRNPSGALVTGGDARPMTMHTAASGAISFTVRAADGTDDPVAITGGALAGHTLALGKLGDVRGTLDAATLAVIHTANAAQFQGIALDGSRGEPLFSGTGAASMKLALEQGAGLATAPRGTRAGSRDAGNLERLRSEMALADPAGRLDALLFDISSTVQGRGVTRDALAAIAGNARVALSAQAGVSLDDEAVNLVRYQQAFQASGKVMQVASTLFDTLLGIR